NPLYGAVYGRLHYERPNDPDWVALQELDEKARQAARGEIPFKEILEKETAPAQTSAKQGEATSHLSLEEQRALNEVALQRRLFRQEIQRIIDDGLIKAVDSKTQKALKAVSKMCRELPLDDQALADLLDVLKELLVQVQWQENGLRKIVFLGENSAAPKASEFYPVDEINGGIPFSKVDPVEMSTIAWRTVGKGEDKSFTNIILKQNVTNMEVRLFLEHLITEKGYNIRMGSHEIGWDLKDNRFYENSKAKDGLIHVHFEKMYNNEILSLEVQIDARALVANKYTDQDILGQYKKYFYPHLKLK
ncbi:MAG: hypothetical protein IKO35_07060, partial [Elusimicrobiaceae bacterium]|nr:hypothetical protein [Elusimicrobiaceae bacterium]